MTSVGHRKETERKRRTGEVGGGMMGEESERKEKYEFIILWALCRPTQQITNKHARTHTHSGWV